MGKPRAGTNSMTSQGMRPALTPEARENQLINAAINLAEKQLLDGTASSQVLTHYLKLAAEKEKARVELEILEKQKELISAKTESLRSAKKQEEMFAEAIKWMRRYKGDNSGDED